MTTNTPPKLILIVEDSPEIQVLMKRLFESNDFEVHCASTGKEALDFLRATSTLPCVILLDLMMPDMNGYEFKKHQEADDRLSKIPVVVMSADRDFASKKQSVGVQGFIAKPFDINKLLAVVEQHC